MVVNASGTAVAAVTTAPFKADVDVTWCWLPVDVDHEDTDDIATTILFAFVGVVVVFDAIIVVVVAAFDAVSTNDLRRDFMLPLLDNWMARSPLDSMCAWAWFSEYLRTRQSALVCFVGSCIVWQPLVALFEPF